MPMASRTRCSASSYRPWRASTVASPMVVASASACPVPPCVASSSASDACARSRAVAFEVRDATSIARLRYWRASSSRPPRSAARPARRSAVPSSSPPAASAADAQCRRTSTSPTSTARVASAFQSLGSRFRRCLSTSSPAPAPRKHDPCVARRTGGSSFAPSPSPKRISAAPGSEAPCTVASISRSAAPVTRSSTVISTASGSSPSSAASRPGALAPAVSSRSRASPRGIVRPCTGHHPGAATFGSINTTRVRRPTSAIAQRTRRNWWGCVSSVHPTHLGPAASQRAHERRISLRCAHAQQLPPRQRRVEARVKVSAHPRDTFRAGAHRAADPFDGKRRHAGRALVLVRDPVEDVHRVALERERGLGVAPEDDPERPSREHRALHVEPVGVGRSRCQHQRRRVRHRVGAADVRVDLEVGQLGEEPPDQLAEALRSRVVDQDQDAGVDEPELALDPVEPLAGAVLARIRCIRSSGCG